MIRTALMTAAVFTLAAGARAQVGAPVLGYVPRAGRIVPVNGIAAAASAGTALDFGDTFRQIAISPQQDFALVSSASSGAVLVATPAGASSAIAGVSANPDQVALSPNGSAAVLWFASARSFEILSGLPSAPVVRRFDATFLSGASNDVPTAMAVSDDGAWAAGAWSTGKSPAGVWAFGPDGEARRLMLPDRILALAFFPGSQNLALAAASGIFSITDVGGSASLSTLYTAAQRLTPAGLAVAPDNATLVLAETSGTILTVHSDSGATGQTACGCSPWGLAGMGNWLFRIQESSPALLRIFDARQGSVFLVPLGSKQSGGGSQ